MHDGIETLVWTAIIEKWLSVENFMILLRAEKLLTADKFAIHILTLILTCNPTQYRILHHSVE